MTSYKKSYRHFVESISAIEQSFDVNIIKYNNLRIWPLVRLYIWTNFYHFEKKHITEQKKAFSDNKKPVLCASQKLIQSLVEYKNKDILFLSRFEEYKNQIKGKYYNPFIDSIIELFKDSYTSLKIELSYPDTQKTIPRYKKTFFIKPEALHYVTDNIVSINGFNNFQRVIQEITGINVDESIILKQARFIYAWELFFTEILEALNPKAVFLVCYYYIAAMSLIKTCKNLSIPTVDIQHGICGNYHALYTHWTSIPDEGYDLVPEYFWCWGNSFKNSIEKWYSPGFLNQKPIVGGNLQIIHWLDNDNLIINKNMKLFYKRLEKNDKIILITLQGPDLPLPKFFFETLKKSPDDWLWLFRLHPTHSTEKYKIDLYNKVKVNSSNFEFEYATLCPLFDLLKRCNHHVTLSSAVAYEALAFNVPTTLLDISLELFVEDINKGVFSYAQNSYDLLNSIRHGFFNTDLINSSDYIEIDKQYSKRLINNVLTNNSKNISEKEQFYEQKIKNSLALNELGESFFKKGYKKTSYNIFLKTIIINPEFALPYNNLGVLCWNDGKNDYALELFAKAYELTPYDSNIVFNYIKILLHFNKYNDAKRILLSYLNKNSGD